MPLLSKTVQADARVLQRGLLFLFLHWFNEGCCVERGETGEEVRSMRKVTRKRVYKGHANPNPLTPKEDDRTERHLKYYIHIDRGL